MCITPNEIVIGCVWKCFFLPEISLVYSMASKLASITANINDIEVIEIAIESPNSYVNDLSNLMKILTK